VKNNKPMRIKVKIIPRASRSEIVGEMPDGTLRVRVTAPPVDGKANEELIELLSDKYNIPKSKIQITHGLTSRNKTIEW
jgi:uncharacterized protein (TIGR00251 family)